MSPLPVSQTATLTEDLEIQRNLDEEPAAFSLSTRDTGDYDPMASVHDVESSRGRPFHPFSLSDRRRIQVGLPSVNYEKVVQNSV